MISVGKRRSANRGMDVHHVCFDGYIWKSDDCRILRNDPNLKIVLPRSVHELLHAEVPPLPPLGRNMQRLLVRLYRQKLCEAGDWGNIRGIVAFLDSLGVIVNEPDLPGRPRRICQLELRQIQLMQENLISQVQIIRTDEVLAGQLADVYL